MKFLANENFPPSSIKILRTNKHKVISINEEAKGSKDLQVLKIAQNEDMILLTFDKDYGELIYKYKEIPPAGIICFRFIPNSAEEPAEVLLNIIESKQISLIGKYTVIEKDKIRQRNLKNY